ncbi:cyclic-phosphate processing receiver domain-containing protein [Bacillus sp. EB01]|uniref:cyclic-phosphate processing receiver domain-containing protein n=1 Tax=Bacillus sp. EB01 TaxID=1347086 RepID=UPI0005C52288|nr:cyclic-phosphate processing receiver domain-containing protein [Bacillus sp. EB01]
MEKISVFLDDYRQPPTGYVLVKTIDECIELLERYPIHHLSLDHDLTDKRRNGLMLVQHMVKKGLFAGRITIHSANSVGGKAMYNHLKSAQANFSWPSHVVLSMRPLPLESYPLRTLKYYVETYQ